MFWKYLLFSMIILQASTLFAQEFNDATLAIEEGYDQTAEAVEISQDTKKSDFLGCTLAQFDESQSTFRSAPLGMTIGTPTSVRSKQFYLELVEDLLEYHNLSRQINEGMLACLNTPTCARESQTVSDVREAAYSARKDLAIGKSRRGRVNPRLRWGRKSFKKVGWDPLAPDELASHQSELNQFINSATRDLSIEDIKKIRNEDPSFRPDDRSNILVDLHKDIAFSRYQATLTRWPVLHYIKSATPDELEIKQAIKKVIEHNEATIKQIAKIKEKLVNWNPLTGYFDHSINNLLGHGEFVQALLMEKPEYCSVATGLSKMHRRRGNVFGLGGLALFMGAALVLPPTALIIGSVAGAIHVDRSLNRNLDRLEDHSISAIEHSPLKKVVLTDEKGKETIQELFVPGNIERLAGARNEIFIEHAMNVGGVAGTRIAKLLAKTIKR